MTDDPQTARSRRRVGAVLHGKWVLERLIGVGGCGAVYAARHRNGARAAIKLLHAEYAAYPDVTERFLREAYIANSIRHDGVVKVLDDDVTPEGEPYLVMELLEGRSVGDWAARAGGLLGVSDALAVVDQTLEILEQAHAVGVVHRDLKPENLFWLSEGRVKLLDFGIARLRDGADSRTRTGVTMGTPIYMAPEQALARWDDVDARTDLWSVGAILFTLLTGYAVHEGETDGVVLVQAATRPARSLARVMPSAPFALVRLVDRALEYVPARRFQDAASMRAEVRALRGLADEPPRTALGADTSATEGGLAAGRPSPLRSGATPAGGRLARSAQGLAATGVGASGAHPTAVDPTAGAGATHGADVLAGVEALELEAEGGEGLAATAEFFSALGKMLVARGHYPANHPELRRRQELVSKRCQAALAANDGGLFWRVTPYSFEVGGETVWMPEPPFERVPYQLFADGFRAMALLPGLAEHELAELVRILLLDRARDMAPEDDFATVLWDAGLEHVTYHVIDGFDDGDQDARLRAERQRAEIIASADADTSAELARAWAAPKPQAAAGEVGRKQQRILRLLDASLATDGEAASRAVGTLEAGAAVEVAAASGRALRLDEAVRTLLAAQLGLDTGASGRRFVLAAAEAFEVAESRRTGSAISAPLRAALDDLAAEHPAAALAFVSELCQAVGGAMPPGAARARLRGALTGGLVSASFLELLLGCVTAGAAERAALRDGVVMLLEHLGGEHFARLLASLPALLGTELGEPVIAYLERSGAGHEAELAEAFRNADLEFGLIVLRVLAALDSPAAREAIARAVESRHAVVRIAALGYVEGVSSERLRLELGRLLDDPELDVRLAALDAMRKHAIRAAGPFLVLRIRSRRFEELSLEERRESLITVAALAPQRAETLGIELLGGLRRLFASSAREETRELVAEMLGRVGVSAHAEQALETAASAKWRNSERVRASATQALGELRARREASAESGRPADRSLEEAS